jgi:hypothetical protein
MKSPLDPLLLKLCKDYTTEADLSDRIKKLFEVDSNDTFVYKVSEFASF